MDILASKNQLYLLQIYNFEKKTQIPNLIKITYIIRKYYLLLILHRFHLLHRY